jgi:hypothetical protein
MSDTALRDQLIHLLHSSHAHAAFADVVDGFPVELAGVRPAGLPHSAWELLEHMRIAQHDILRFSESSEYISPKWPDEYWPESQAPGDANQWDASVQQFRRDLAAFEDMIRDKTRDLYTPFPWGEGQTLLREALLIADHNSYHLGQFMLVRKALAR